jgi:hypothetical protein
MPDFPDFLHTDNQQLWLLIGVCIAMVFTIEAVEEAVEGAWPHQRRVTGMGMSERRAQPFWGVVALLVLPGAILTVLNLAVIAWKELPRNDALVLGTILLGTGWAIFLLCSTDRLRMRKIFAAAGPAAPIVLTLILIAANVLLLVSFLDIRPSVDAVRNALPALI